MWTQSVPEYGAETTAAKTDNRPFTPHGGGEMPDDDQIAARVTEILQDAKAVHLLPDDVVVFTNIDLPDSETADRLNAGIKDVLGTRGVILCAPGVEVNGMSAEAVS